jgi:hypothetical protein
MPTDPKIVQLPFGPGLDKETGLMVVKPNTMQDLRNVYHHEGSIVVRSGTEKTNEFFDGQAGWTQYGVSVGTGDDATHILAGIAIRSERVGIVVSWENTLKRVGIWRVDALGGNSIFIGFWPYRYYLETGVADFEWRTFTNEPPKVVLAEIYGMVFFAHDEKWDAFRAATYVYDPWKESDEHYSGFGNTLGPVVSDLAGDPDLEQPEVLRFRGVVRHLEYLFGWGWGSAVLNEIRPELLRVSNPGDPKTFDPDHYFIVGDKRDPVISAAPARQTLLVCKETDTYQVIGYSRATFGIRPYDQLYGCLASRLMVSVSGDVHVWSAEGPMVGGDVGPFQKTWLPLDLNGFEPATLVERINFDDGWADYIDMVELVIFCFGRRAYILSVRNPQDPRWTYWELGKKAYCGFRLYGDEGDIGNIPTGYMDNLSITYDIENGCRWPTYTVNGDNNGQSNTDLIELWHRPMGPFWIRQPAMPSLVVDTNGDGVPDGWTSDDSVAGGQAVYIPNSANSGGIGMVLSGLLAQDDYARIYYDTSSVTVGNKYRFEASYRTLSYDLWVLTSYYTEVRMEFLGAADAVLQTHSARWPDYNYQKLYLEGTAPASTLKIRFSFNIKSINPVTMSANIVAIFRSPLWYEEDSVNPGAWVRAWGAELVGPEANRDLPPATATEPGMDYEIAVRYVNVVGQAGTGYTGDPDTWPAGSRATAEIPMTEPGFFRITYVNDGPAPIWNHFLIEPGCQNDLPDFEAGESFSFQPPYYTNRDIEIAESIDGAAASTIFIMPRNTTLFRRRLVITEINKEYSYAGRYLGPDRNSAYGPPTSIYAADTPDPPGGGEPPQFFLSKEANGVYRINIALANEYNDIDGDGVPDPAYPVGVVIEDNYDGAGGLLAAGTWDVAFSSCRDINNVKHQFPTNNIIDLGKQARGLAITVRVREYYKAGDLDGYNWISCIVGPGQRAPTPPLGTEYGPWADPQTVTV